MSLKENDTYLEAILEAEEEEREARRLRIEEEIDWLFKDHSNVPHGAHNQGIAYQGERP